MELRTKLGATEVAQVKGATIWTRRGSKGWQEVGLLHTRCLEFPTGATLAVGKV